MCLGAWWQGTHKRLQGNGLGQHEVQVGAVDCGERHLDEHIVGGRRKPGLRGVVCQAVRATSCSFSQADSARMLAMHVRTHACVSGCATLL